MRAVILNLLPISTIRLENEKKHPTKTINTFNVFYVILCSYKSSIVLAAKSESLNRLLIFMFLVKKTKIAFKSG